MNKQHGHLPSHTRMLMYGHHHASGGASNTMPGNTPIYKKGGSTHKHRTHHAEGDLTGVNPITGTRSPDILERKRGGSTYRKKRACHAEGDVVATPYKKGGATKRRRKHHADGGMESMLQRPRFGRILGDELTALKRGGSLHKKRQHHADGGQEEQENMKRGGLKKKKVRREHHNFGDDVLGFLKDAGSAALQTAPMWLPALLKEGGSAHPKLAAGGVGKIRKGMMSKSGKILNSQPHARMYNPR